MPTTNLVIRVDGGVIYAVETRGYFETKQQESHEPIEKIHEFNPRLFGTKCGLKKNNRLMFEHLTDNVDKLLKQNINPTPYGVATAALEFIQGRGKQFEIANLFVGVDEQGIQVYQVENQTSGVVEVADYAAIGTGAKAALKVLGSKFRMDMTEEEVVSLAFDALAYASLMDRKSGGYLCVNFMSVHGEVKRLREPALHKYLERFSYLQSLFEGESALLLLLPIDYEGEMAFVLNVLSSYGHVLQSHCLGCGGELKTTWEFPYHVLRIQYEEAEAADLAYNGLVQQWEQDQSGAIFTQDFGNQPLTWMKISERNFDPAAIVCVETRKKLEVIMTSDPHSWSHVDFIDSKRK
ncbi:hypothetical protein C1H46_035138 [Malus baccata]|uniref:Proteasome endopeptidase complex n=1 Tax=Malus baccata TaxID=106549 RepID=A0A540KYJ8_MALBA|nr:hypothetical protein C1H46_035138 [Malus baccata]